jgi:hypothetical protein
MHSVDFGYCEGLTGTAGLGMIDLGMIEVHNL